MKRWPVPREQPGLALTMARVVLHNPGNEELALFSADFSKATDYIHLISLSTFVDGDLSRDRARLHQGAGDLFLDWLLLAVVFFSKPELAE